MKIHKHLTLQLSQALLEIFTQERAHADKVIERYFKLNKKWGARDRRFFAEATYDIVRAFRLYWNLAGFSDFGDITDIRPDLDAESLLKVWAAYYCHRGFELPDWPEIRDINPNQIQQRFKSIKSRAVIHSIPDWLDKWGLESFKSEWSEILVAMEQPAEVYLRSNSLKIGRAALQRALIDEGVHTVAVDSPKSLYKISSAFDCCIKLTERKNIFSTRSFQSGLFEVQDAASQVVAPFLKVEPGMRVIDACAGAGGKSLHIASLMKNKGKLISMDIHDWKLNELQKRAGRNGVDIIETKHIDSTKVIKRSEDSADRLLLDVPCSGLGVLKRNPDAKWRLSLNEIAELQKTQKEILERYSSMLKVGGKMVYATCSIFPQENHLQVQEFLKNHPQFQLEEELSLRPDKEGFDGFYMARMARVSE